MKNERIFWGVFFILCAVAMVAAKLGLLGGFNFWTALFTVFLAACLVKSISKRDMTGVLFSTAFLCIVYDEPLGITALTPWTVLGAAFLGSIGFSILRRPEMKSSYRAYNRDFSQETVNGGADGVWMNLESNFAGSVKYIRSENFKGADLRCNLGAMKVYFDNAVIRGDEAEIRLDLHLGGAELYVPKEWCVVNEATAYLGGVEEKNSGGSAGTPRLRLTGSITLSGVTIIYV